MLNLLKKIVTNNIFKYLLICINQNFFKYRLINTNPEEVPTLVNNGAIIKVYYGKRTDLTATINHYLTNSHGENPTLQETQELNNLTYNEILTGSTYKKNYDGYTYYSSNPEAINITTGTNVINLYYREISGKEYTINHYLQNLNDDNYTL